MLGTVDRASVHDLVLDFTCGLFAPEELQTAHQRIVDSFRKKRTVSATGISAWLRSNGDDPTSHYVLSEIEHHVRNAIPHPDQLADGDPIVAWLEDQPQDAIGEATAAVLGIDVLDQLATTAEEKRSPDFWGAACRWGAGATLCLNTIGRTDPFLTRTRKSLDAIIRIDNSGGDTHESRGSQDAQDFLEICQLKNVFFALMQEDRDKYLYRCTRLMHTRAAKAKPENAYIISLFSRVVVAYFNGDLDSFAKDGWPPAVQLIRDGCNAQDKVVRQFCSM